MNRSSMKHVHICGAPRSGTTLLLELMRACYRWDWAPEMETTLLDAPRHRTGRCLSKTPGRGNHVRSILRDPRMWLVYCQRDPRDIVCSRHGMAPDVYWANLRQWRDIRRKIVSIADHPRLVVIRYEDLVRDPDGVQEMLDLRIPWLDRTAAFSGFHEISRPSTQSLDAMRGLRPVDTNGIGRWRQHRARVAGQILHHGQISRELVEDGYEQDGSWVAEIAHVVPDLAPGYWPDRVPLHRQLRARVIAGLDVVRLALRSR